MKLSLAAKNGVNILNVAGAVDIKNFQILKAGITKLLKDGKNKILLNFQGAEKIEADVIREVAILDILARELSGRIAISCDNPELKQEIVNFSKPPVIPIFATDDLAVEFFNKAEANKEQPEVTADEINAIKATLEKKEKEILALQEHIKTLDPAEMQKLRVEKQELVTMNNDLEQRLKDMVITRRSPPDEASYMEKIAQLEQAVKDLTSKAQAAAPKA